MPCLRDWNATSPYNIQYIFQPKKVLTTGPNAPSVFLSKMHRGFEKVLESGSKEKRIHIVCKCIRSKRSKTHQNENNDPADKIAGKRENNKKNANKSVIVKALAGETF